jgi:hypothetical protein
MEEMCKKVDEIAMRIIGKDFTWDRYRLAVKLIFRNLK